jgi:MFS family permease
MIPHRDARDQGAARLEPRLEVLQSPFPVATRRTHADPRSPRPADVKALLQVYRGFTAEARAFLAGAALIEAGNAFQYALQNLYVISLGLSVADAGWINGASAVGVVAATFPSASLYDRLGPRRALVLASVLKAASIAGIALSGSFWWLVAWSALSGASYTLHKVVAAPFLVATSRGPERTHLFQADFAVHTLTQMLGFIVSCLLAGSMGQGPGGHEQALRLALLAGAGIGLLAWRPYRRLPHALPGSAEAASRSPLAVLSILRRSRWHLWMRLSIPHFLVGIGAGLSIPFINLYFTERFELPFAALGLVLAAASATMTLGAVVTPRVVARFGLVRATILTEALSIPFFLVLALTTSFPLAVAAYILRSAFMNLSQPLWRNLMMEITPVEHRPAVNGASMLCWNLGWALSNHWGGWLIESSAGWLGAGLDGYALPMLLTIAMYLLAIALEARFFWSFRHVGQVLPAPPPPVATA